LAAALVAYNTFRPEFEGAAYVWTNLVAALAVGALALGPLKANNREIGVTVGRPAVIVMAAGAAIVLAAPLLLLAAFEDSAHLIADQRAANLDASEVTFQALIRIPIGTALFEEFVFRGVLFGLFSRRGRSFGAIASSIPFGLWHIRPSLEVIHANFSDVSPAAAAMLVTAAVLATAAVGIGLCRLRIKGDGIAAPWAFHASLNSLALVAAWLAHRQIG
jgi:membrane protease YdiL (CAAX protease family)